jgi:hypothetical protein
MMKKLLSILLLGLLLVSTVPVRAQSITRIVITPNIKCLQLGETVSFTAQAYDESGTLVPGAAFQWSLQGPGSLSSNSGSSVSYQATRDGEVTITASSASVSASVRFSVGSGKVRNVQVRVDPDTAGAVAEYYIFFETDDCGILEPGDQIYIAFPVGTILPNYYHCSTVTVNGITASYEVRESSDRSKSPILIITVPNHFRPSSSIYIRVCKVINPRGGSCYVLAAATSKQTQWVLSSPYSIRGSIISPPIVEVKPDIAGEIATYKISFKTSNSGRLSGCYGSFIMIEFPASTKMPREILPEHILVNNVPSCPHIKPEINGRTVKIFPQMVVIEDSDVVIQFTLEAGFANPEKPDDYQLAVWTSSDTIRVLSRSYKIRASTIEDLQVEVDKPYIQTPSMYTIKFKTGLVGRLGIGALITIYFPSSMTLPIQARPGSIKINGMPTIKNPIFDGKSILRIPSPVEIDAKSQVEIVFTEEFGLINPPDPRRYFLEVQTAKEGTLVKSNEFVIGPSVVGDVSVRLSMPYIGVASAVELSFVSGGGGKMTAEKDRIFIVFPKGTHIPNAISKNAITIQGQNILITPFIKKEIGEIMLHVPIDIPAQTRVVVRFDESAGLLNPSQTGFYRYQIATSREVSYIQSPPIEITESTVRFVQVKAHHNTMKEMSRLAITFQLGDAGKLDKNDRVRCFFDSGFVLPESIVKGIILNSVPVDPANILLDSSKDMLEIRLTEAYPEGSLMSLEIQEEAGIRNPTKPGMHQMGISTSKETRTIASPEFRIIPLPSTEYALDPLTPDGQKEWYISEPSIALKVDTEDKDRAVTFVSINGAEWTKYTQPIQFSSGEYYIEFYSQHSDSAKEEKQTLSIKVDTKAPIIQIIENTFYTNKSNYKLSLTIIESWFDYAIIGDQRVESLVEGKLTANILLQEGENKIAILVYDLAGHRSEEHLTIILDTEAPKLEIQQPLPWSKSIRKRIWITGSTDPDAVISCNDQNLRHKEGYFEGFIPLLPGLNALNFLAVDQAGNEKRYTLPIQYAANFQAEIFIDKATAQSSFGEIHFEAPAFIEKSYSMVPLRVFAELMGYQIEFEPVFQIITMREFGGKTIRAQVGNTIFTVDDQKKSLPVAPMIRNGRTFVPLRFFAEEFGFEVSYRKESHSVILQYHEPTE